MHVLGASGAEDFAAGGGPEGRGGALAFSIGALAGRIHRGKPWGQAPKVVAVLWRRHFGRVGRSVRGLESSGGGLGARARGLLERLAYHYAAPHLQRAATKRRRRRRPSHVRR